MPSEADILCPFCPLNTAELILYCHKKCIVGKPPAVFCNKFLIIRILADVAVFVSFAEKLITAFVDFFIVYAVCSSSPADLITVLLCKDAVPPPVPSG